MEAGQRLLGALELAGAALIAAGITVHALRKRLKPLLNNHKSIKGRSVLILGCNNPLGAELVTQFSRKGCRVAKVPSPPVGTSWKKDYLKNLALTIKETFGEPDILIYVLQDNQNNNDDDPLNRLSNMVDNDLKEHFHVVSQFIPDLARRSGHFVTVGSADSRSKSFASTEAALSSLTDAITRRMAFPGDRLAVTRAVRRTKRRGHSDSAETSAAAILDAIEVGKTAITLPPATEHFKNVIRHILAEAKHLWNDMTRRQWKLAS